MWPSRAAALTTRPSTPSPPWGHRRRGSEGSHRGGNREFLPYVDYPRTAPEGEETAPPPLKYKKTALDLGGAGKERPATRRSPPIKRPARTPPSSQWAEASACTEPKRMVPTGKSPSATRFRGESISSIGTLPSKAVLSPPRAPMKKVYRGRQDLSPYSRPHDRLSGRKRPRVRHRMARKRRDDRPALHRLHRARP